MGYLALKHRLERGTGRRLRDLDRDWDIKHNGMFTTMAKMQGGLVKNTLYYNEPFLSRGAVVKLVVAPKNLLDFK
jgi:hypothetical protein